MSEGPKYPKPKVVLIDLPKAVEKLQSAGFNVLFGSMRTPYSVRQSAEVVAVAQNFIEPPNLEEMEIVAIDLAAGLTTMPRQDPAAGEWRYWTRSDLGFIDPRSSASRTSST